MLEPEFYNWLIHQKGQKENTAHSRRSDCLRVERVEGNLDTHFEKDRCYALLDKLVYTAEDANHHRPPKHGILIDGNIKNGTATLKQAVSLYAEFKMNMKKEGTVLPLPIGGGNMGWVGGTTRKTHGGAAMGVLNMETHMEDTETITQFDDKCMIVDIRHSAKKSSLYESTRRCWRADLSRAKKADYVLGAIDGRIWCVIKPSRCDYITIELCCKEEESCKNVFSTNPELCKYSRRIAFEGEEMKDDKKYLYKKIIPEKYIPGRNPVRYTY